MAKQRWNHDEPMITIDLTDEMSDNWLAASRLKKQADEGDEAAKKELDRMENTQLVRAIE